MLYWKLLFSPWRYMSGIGFSEDDVGGGGDDDGGSSAGLSPDLQKVVNILDSRQKKLIRAMEQNLGKRFGAIETGMEDVTGYVDGIIEGLAQSQGFESAEDFVDAIERGEVDLDEDDDGFRGEDDVDYDDMDDVDVEGASTEGERRMAASLKQTQYRLKKMQQQIDAANQRASAAEEARQEADRQRMLTEGRRVLADALSKHRCIDVEAALRLVEDGLFYDEDENVWRYENDEGVVFTPEEGVGEALSTKYAFLLPPAAGGGGGSGRSVGGERAGQVADLRQKVDAAKAAADASGTDEAVTAYSAAKRALEAAESGAAP